jgi:hypothetical protein
MTQLWLQAISSAPRHVLSVAEEAQLLKTAPLTNIQLLKDKFTIEGLLAAAITEQRWRLCHYHHRCHHHAHTLRTAPAEPASTSYGTAGCRQGP